MVLYSELVEKYQNVIPYPELLKTREWRERREIILKRDNYTCTKCLKRATREISRETVSKMLGGITVTWRSGKDDRKLIAHLNENDHYWFFKPPEKYIEKKEAYSNYLFFKAKDFVLVRAEKRYHLDIHHKIYVLNKLPWENYDNDLTTLCNWCHEDLHKVEKVLAFYLKDGVLVPAKLTPCFKCKGAGRIPEYAHIEDGICFRCLGKRFEELFTKT